MSDSHNTQLFDDLLRHSLIIESLRATLEQMLANSYIRKDMAGKLLKEASEQYRLLIMENTYFLPRHYIFGQLQHYKFGKTTRILTIKNPIIHFYANEDEIPGRFSKNFKHKKYMCICRQRLYVALRYIWY